ncbi:MAG: DUF1549 domain-containing protein, partial [Verrucomicrobiota bacterium]
MTQIPSAIFPLLLFAWSQTIAAEHSFFDDQVLPVLEEHCYRCHGGEDKLKGDFRLTSREGLLRGGELGPAWDESAPDKSLLLEVIRYENDEYQMPPKGKLSPEKIAILEDWVRSGASYNPDKEIHGEEGEETHHVKESDFSYWAYRPIEDPPVPTTEEAHPIDAFLAEKRGDLATQTAADRATLLRRATYDLTGLPPSATEVQSMLNDARSTEEVWKDQLEELLARPQYGEKWARHWLDLVRYAETNGFERDNPKPHIWQYRDYVVRAFNQDLPYDQFIREQLAGDEIPNPTFDSLVATGFHRLMQWDDEPADRKQHVYDVLADSLTITTETFLASTLGCARCHDHKADPFTQEDYYSFMSFFHGITAYKTPGTIVHWATEEEETQFAAERASQLARLETEIANVDERLRVWLASKDSPKYRRQPQNLRTLVKDARGGQATWDFTTGQPSAEWKDVGFRDKSWHRAHQGGFGSPGTPGSVVNNTWETPDIWLRTSFGLQQIPDTLSLTLHHDEDVTVYLNGTLIYKASGFTTDYQTIPLGQQALDVLQTGRNTLAIHCRHQTGGGQYIDAGLSTGHGPEESVWQRIQRGGKTLAAQIKDDLG